jgi:hypothetical protein
VAVDLQRDGGKSVRGQKIGTASTPKKKWGEKRVRVKYPSDWFFMRDSTDIAHCSRRPKYGT